LYTACESDRRCIDTPDSTICSASYDIARLAVGGCLSAVDAVMEKRIDNAFCAVRPPGHHAESNRSMGFCLFNNIAIAAKYLLAKHSLARVLILDWDVHHGNGTQHTFECDPHVFFCSLHQHPRYLFPGTGWPHETGQGAGEGKTLNLAFMPHATDHDVMSAFQESFIPAARAFAPEFILASIGFDAHVDDPLASLDLTDDAFAWLTDRTMALADELCHGRFISILEGGYDLDVLSRCCVRHVEILMQDAHDTIPENGAELTDHASPESDMRRAAREALPDVIWWW